MTPVEQAAAYEPIFYHHPDEPWRPVHPVGFLKAARLWLAQSPLEQRRKDPRNWGRCRGPRLGNAPSTFQPGEPLIPRSEIGVNSADERQDYPDNHAGPFYLGHDEQGGVRDRDCCDRRFPFTQTTGQCENFLDVGGWQAEEDVTRPNPNPDDYTQPGVARARDIWRSDDRRNDLDVAFVEIVEAAGVLSDEVVSALGRRFPEDDFRIFLYYALFPIHEEAGLGSDRADYEGDWVCLAVVAPAAPAAAAAAPAPVAVGYGSRHRGGRGDTFRIRFVGTFQTHAGHPKAFVANKTHNLHSQPGGDQGPRKEAAAEAIEGVKERVGDKIQTLETVKDVAVVIAKIIAGAGIGFSLGPIGALGGALVGALAGIIEAATTDPPDIDSGNGRPGGGRPGGGGEQVPDGTFGVILAPEAVRATIPEAGAAAEVRRWREDLAQRVVDRNTQPWWRESECLPRPDDRPAYAGRWGVLCTDDRRDRRSGMPFPDFLCALDRSLLEELSADPDA